MIEDYEAIMNMTYAQAAEVLDNARIRIMGGRCNGKTKLVLSYDVAIQKAIQKLKDGWIPVSERLPDDLEPVNITWINHEPEPYYKEIKGKPFTATGVYFNGQWYWWSTLCTDTLAEYSHNYDDIIDKAIEVIAWQPLPEPYKEA